VIFGVEDDPLHFVRLERWEVDSEETGKSSIIALDDLGL
jgi:hypothetical protein